MATASLPNIMILGCGRSGTSIFGELFEQLGPYTYLSEPPFSDIMASDYAGPMAFKVPRASADFPPAPGLSIPIDILLRKMPDTKLFWIVRHPLDAICSLRVGIANSWGHHPRPCDWKKWLKRPLLDQCAHHWDCINSYGFKQVENRAILVRFEEMIADPACFAQTVCHKIGIPSGEVAVSKWADRVQDSNNSRFVEAMTSRSYSRPDHAVRVGRWRENLTKGESEKLWPMVSETAERFGYRITD